MLCYSTVTTSSMPPKQKPRQPRKGANQDDFVDDSGTERNLVEGGLPRRNSLLEEEVERVPPNRGRWPQKAAQKGKAKKPTPLKKVTGGRLQAIKIQTTMSRSQNLTRRV